MHRKPKEKGCFLKPTSVCASAFSNICFKEFSVSSSRLQREGCGSEDHSAPQLFDMQLQTLIL